MSAESFFFFFSLFDEANETDVITSWSHRKLAGRIWL